jgi:AP endonuclease-1
MTLKLMDSVSDSSLSPFPDDLKTTSVAVTADSPPAKDKVNGKKQETETTIKTTRKRKTAVKAEDEADEKVEKPKKRARKVKIEEETVEYVSHITHSTSCPGVLQCGHHLDKLLTWNPRRHEVKAEDGATTKVKTTQKRQTKKKAGDTAPLEQRTEGSKLRVGAHVSIAGGKSPSSPLQTFEAI